MRPAGAGAGTDLLVSGVAVGFISMLIVGGATIVLRLRKRRRAGLAGEDASLLASTA